MAERQAKKLTDREELLLIAYHDGECNFISTFLARRLLKGSPDAAEFLLNFRNFGASLRLDRAGSAHSVDLWNRISARIEAEERAEVMLGERAFRRKGVLAGYGPRWSEWRHRLTWGGSGAAFAAVCSIILVQSGVVGGSSSRASAFEASRSRIPLVAPVAYNNSSGAVSPLEMDWMRSEGRLHVMQDPEANTAIIWVKPRAQAPRVSLAGDFNQHLPRHSSRSNTHIPVAFPAVGH